MPLFGRREPEPVQTTTTTSTAEPARKHGMFSRRRSVSPEETVSTSNAAHKRTGGGLLSRHNEDASITQARERVVRAEAAERDADRALMQARAAVKDAREQVHVLEREAAEEARLARIKQDQARSISKRAKPLGRFDRV